MGVGLPAYRCPKCKRLVVKPEGIYYCKECGGSYVMIKEALPFLESAKKFYASGMVRCPKCGSFNVKGGDGFYWCWSCDYQFAKELVADPNAEVEKAKELAVWRRRGVVEPVTWLDVASAYQRHYDVVRGCLIRAIGGYENIERKKEYWAEPFEAYYKIYITLRRPVEAVFRLIDSDYLEFNGERIPLFINEKAYTPYRLRLYHFIKGEQLETELKARRETKTSLKDFYVQADNPAWYSRFEERFVPRPGIFRFIIYA